MEFVRNGGMPSCKYFYFKHVIKSPGTDWEESYDDYGFKDDVVIMSQSEYDKLTEGKLPSLKDAFESASKDEQLELMRFIEGKYGQFDRDA